MAKIELGDDLTAHIEPRDGTKIALYGVINEASDLSPLLKLRSPLRIDLSGITRINSLGVRTWVLFVRDAEATGVDIVAERCAPVLVQQMGMISNFMGTRSRVASLLVPYVCERCSAYQEQLVEAATGQPLVIEPTQPCTKCGGAMQLDEVAELYDHLQIGRA